MRSLSVLYTTTSITTLLLQEDVMVQESSVIIGVLEEPFIDDGIAYCMSEYIIYSYMFVSLYVCLSLRKSVVCTFICLYMHLCVLCVCVYVHVVHACMCVSV